MLTLLLINPLSGVEIAMQIQTIGLFCYHSKVIGLSENSFDPAKIASKLRELGDDYDEKVIQPLIKNVQRAAADQVVTVFTDSVDSMCKMWVVERAEVASEKQLLKAAITLGLYMKENCPDMTNAVEVAVTGFINNRLTNWIAEQGGWHQSSTRPATNYTPASFSASGSYKDFIKDVHEDSLVIVFENKWQPERQLPFSDVRLMPSADYHKEICKGDESFRKAIRANYTPIAQSTNKSTVKRAVLLSDMHFWSIHAKLMLMSNNEEATKHLETSKQLAFVFQEEVRVHKDLMGLAFSSHGTNNQQACKVPSITAIELEEELHIQDQWRDPRGSKSGQKWQLASAYQEEVWMHEDLIGLAFSSHGTNSAAIEAVVAVTMAAILREALPAVTDSQ
ncbi:Fragile X mental retardation syndrome-related protein 2 [Anabarilius grahami]|uniref:Fragile X mental retardation syndrome-related protein 2 n=1 Tax=Anabarilius grahami TaxID=495550 RepID=A0A3N0YQJ6_ANAGA|nr:Fragile X mental retardation syndrome-related protein 2 [Anabarilius grahami]